MASFQPKPTDRAFSQKYKDLWVEGYLTENGIVITNVIGGWGKLFDWSPRSEKSKRPKKYNQQLTGE